MSFETVQIGDCTLICGDCLEVLSTLDKGSVDAVVTDPPYGISFAARPTKWQRRAGAVADAWDDSPGNIEALANYAPIVVIWGGNYFPLPQSRGWLSWFKPDAPPSMASIELAWTNRDMNFRQISHSISATNRERVGFATQKPIRVIEWCMDVVDVPQNATVLDAFMGSGTTGVCCIRTGRKFIGIEKKKEHFDLACNRVRKAYADRPMLLEAV